MLKNKEKLKEDLARFFDGRLYPLIVALLVTVSAVTGLELVSCVIISLLFITSALACDSVKPFIIVFVTFVMQMSLKHSPSEVVNKLYGDGNPSYYFTSYRIWLIAICIGSMVIACGYFFVKNKCYKRIKLKDDKLLIATLALVLSFILGGAFTGGWLISLPHALMQVATYLLVYLLFAYGFSENDTRGGLIDYFSYISLLTAGVVIVQMIVLFIRSEHIFIDGGINKEGIMLGFGIWTLVGITLAMLIPMIFYGAMKGGRRAVVYFIGATLAWIFALLSMSRNAQLFSTLAYCACVLISAFKAKNKLFYRALSCLGAVGVVACVILLYDKIPGMLSSFLDDNGRGEHASIAISNFLHAPVFGVGFSGFELFEKLNPFYAPMGPWPSMAHNTVLELMSALGIFGVLAYGFYRVTSLIPLFKKPTLGKATLFVAIFVILLSSLLDNFVFDVYPMFYTGVALSIAHARLAET